MDIQKHKKSEIVPFPPGYVETFELQPNGNVALVESEKFHSLGTSPKWMDVPESLVSIGKSENGLQKCFKEEKNKNK